MSVGSNSTSLDSIEKLKQKIATLESEKEQLNEQLSGVKNRLFQNIFSKFIEGIIMFSPDGQIINANQSFCDSIGLSQDKIEGEYLQSLIPPDELGDFHHLWQELFTVGYTSRKIKLLINGETKIFEMSSSSNALDEYCIAVFRDITERTKYEEQLRKSDMLNVVGELAAGIAHEIRNPLTSLKGFIQLLNGSVEGYSIYFNIIMSELNRIESIVSEFLYLANPQAVQYKMSNVVKIMEETIELMKAQAIMENVQFQTHFQSSSYLVYCEPNQIKQVFINIVKNAMEVMSKKGGFVTITIREEEDYVCISIKDEGHGVSEETLKKFGQPFFTTKEKGTGLGLMVSYKIIREHKGLIEVESELGKGTTFHIYLPNKSEV